MPDTSWEEPTRRALLERLDFLSDHWVNGDDKPPFNFGGWREEIADAFIEIIRSLLAAERAKWEKEIKVIIMKDCPSGTNFDCWHKKAVKMIVT